jgi:hypothetical protein
MAWCFIKHRAALPLYTCLVYSYVRKCRNLGTACML